ncbi:RICIN domain-containing protein [Streptomyces sp. NPDC007162]|uniref:RICIN domain-containing protein n=1 Tax=Streptomyces sp. NPDC007162 TaxID=3156917 RepID=UPI0034050C4D
MGLHGLRDDVLPIQSGRDLRDTFVRTNGSTPQNPPEPAYGRFDSNQPPPPPPTASAAHRRPGDHRPAVGALPRHRQLHDRQSKCLGVGPSAGSGSPAAIRDCDGRADQQWNVNPDGTITAVRSGLCLDADDQATGNRRRDRGPAVDLHGRRQPAPAPAEPTARPDPAPGLAGDRPPFATPAGCLSAGARGASARCC